MTEPLSRVGAASIRWRTQRDRGEPESYLVELALADAAGGPLSPSLIRRGFAVLYVIADWFDPAGVGVSLDLVTGCYERQTSRPIRQERQLTTGECARAPGVVSLAGDER